MTNLTTTPLSAEVKVTTANAHDEAEHSPFMDDLLSGRSGREEFVRLTGQLWFVYDALESACRAHADDPRISPLIDRRLERLPALEADLSTLLGEDWRDRLAPRPATSAYTHRLRTCAPHELAAHHYTRYLGDLSGGQVIPTMLRRHYDLTEGMSFYSFDEIDKIKPYKDAYRARLDDLPLDEAERQQFLEEAVEAFVLNTAMFDDLAR